MPLNLPASTSQDEYITLMGGFDQTTPLSRIKPGTARDARNFEASITGGYTRVAGYERVDGRPAPSDAIYLTLTLNITGAISAGNTIVGVTSGATGVVIYVSGGLVAYSKAVGAFQVGETVNVSASPQATVLDLGGGEAGLDFDARMAGLAADLYRADIGAIPGSGPTRGVISFKGGLFGFRDNAGATALAIYKATPSGWSNVALPYSVPFDTGTSEYPEGSTISKGGNSATVLRVCTESGSWTAGTAKGRIICTQPTPGAFTAGAAAGGGACNLTGGSAQITILPGGTISSDVGVVGSTRRVYGVDGVNKAFEFDGTTYVPIVTGNVVDAPTRVMVHSGHLFLAFGASLQHSGIGDPFNWTAVAGAGEVLADGDITAMRRMPGAQDQGTAVIASESGTQMLYGQAEPFQLISFEDEAGAKAYSLGRLGALYALGNQGIVSVATSQAFGNFAANAITVNIRRWFALRLNSVTGSIVVRSKNQYRLFFSDGSALYVTLNNGKLVGAMPVYFPDVVRCACDCDSSDEMYYFGSDAGFVYQMEKGTSFDGDPIEWDLLLAFTNQRSPNVTKRYRRATFEVQGEGYARFSVAFDVEFGGPGREQPSGSGSSSVDLAMTIARWDESLVWDEFIWDGSDLLPTTVEISGSGTNVATRVTGSSAIYAPFTLNSLTLTYSVRARTRSTA